jgi:hypothetical protein
LVCPHETTGAEFAGGTGDDDSGWIPGIPTEELYWSSSSSSPSSSFGGLGGLGIPLDKVRPKRGGLAIFEQLALRFGQPTELEEGLLVS